MNQSISKHQTPSPHGVVLMRCAQGESMCQRVLLRLVVSFALVFAVVRAQAQEPTPWAKAAASQAQTARAPQPVSVHNAANTGPERDTGFVPTRATERPLALPRGTLSSSTGLGMSFVAASGGGERGGSTEIGTSLQTSIALGIVDAFEIGIVPIRLFLTPDFEASNPLMYLRSAFVRGSVFQMGMAYSVSLPVTEDTSYVSNTLNLDFLIRSRAFRFRTTFYSAISVPIDSSDDLFVTPGFSLNFAVQAGPFVALGLRFNNSFFDASVDGYQLSVAPSISITVPRRGDDTSPLVDLAATFGLPGLVSAGRSEVVNADVKTLTLSALFYTDLW